MTEKHLLLIAGMFLVIYIPRALPLLLLSSRSLHPMLARWLDLVPPAVLMALLVSEILVTGPAGERRLFIGTENIFLLAAVPAFITGFLTRGFFGTVAVGMAAVALARLLMQ